MRKKVLAIQRTTTIANKKTSRSLDLKDIPTGIWSVVVEHGVEQKGEQRGVL